MKTNMIVVDNFYSNVDEVRDFALHQQFNVAGNYPGRRTKSFLNDSMQELISKILHPHGGNVTSWGSNEYTGAYQYTLAADRSWIHHDGTTSWAGVCYLTPNAPLSSGTAIYRHKETGIIVAPKDDPELEHYVSSQGNDMTKWEVVDRVSNIYNRLVMYRGDNYHMSQDYFGTDINNGRLFQTFFITTEF